jgi:hypothetical protein
MTAHNPYAGDRIDYMNARRAAKPATGGTNYARYVNPVDERARVAGLNEFDLLREKLDAVFTECRSVVRNFRNDLAAGLTADDMIPF